jgi:hypothetical protein
MVATLLSYFTGSNNDGQSLVVSFIKKHPSLALSAYMTINPNYSTEDTSPYPICISILLANPNYIRWAIAIATKYPKLVVDMIEILTPTNIYGIVPEGYNVPDVGIVPAKLFSIIKGYMESKNKISAVKEIRVATGWGLKESKDAMDYMWMHTEWASL